MIRSSQSRHNLVTTSKKFQKSPQLLVRVSRFGTLWCCRRRDLRQSCVHRTLEFSHSNLGAKKDQKPFGFWSWSECRDSNSRPLEPHFYGLFSIQRFLEAFCGILSTKTNKPRTNRDYINISKNHSSENW